MFLVASIVFGPDLCQPFNHRVIRTAPCRLGSSPDRETSAHTLTACDAASVASGDPPESASAPSAYQGPRRIAARRQPRKRHAPDHTFFP